MRAASASLYPVTIAAPTPRLRSWMTTSTRGSPAVRARSAVASVEASSTTKILSTKPGIPWIVAAIELLLVVRRHDDRDALALEHGPIVRRGAVSRCVCRRRSATIAPTISPIKAPIRIDALRECADDFSDLAAVITLALSTFWENASSVCVAGELVEQVPLALQRRVELRDQHELVERLEVPLLDRLVDGRNPGVDRLELCPGRAQDQVVGRDLRADVRRRGALHDDRRERVRRILRLRRVRSLDGERDQRRRARCPVAGGGSDLGDRHVSAQRAARQPRLPLRIGLGGGGAR